MLKRILTGVCDLHYTASAAYHSTELAQRFGASITAMAVTDVERLRRVGPAGVGSATWRQEMIADRIEKNDAAIRQSLDVLSRICKEAHVECHEVRAGALPYDKLHDASRYHDLMVFGLKGMFEHGVIAEPPNELVQLIASGVQPVLAVGPQYREVKKVLVAYSGSVESAKTIRTFNQMNLWPDIEIRAIHIDNRDDDGPTLLNDIRKYFAAHDKVIQTEFVIGDPKNELLPYAEEWNADLIVVGNSAKSLLRRRVFGETALTAMRESEIPLFLSQ